MSSRISWTSRISDDLHYVGVRNPRPITPAAFVNSRRYVYHVCGDVNFDAIRTSRTLRSAKLILEGTGHDSLLRGKRNQTQNVIVNGSVVQIRDHKPLISANIELEESYTLTEFLQELNSRVFMWAGTEFAPCKSGRNHIQKYQDEGSVFILRAPTHKLPELNGLDTIEITFCNSGAARRNNGQRVKRGRGTFIRLDQATRQPGEIVEVTFQYSARLPQETEYATALTGPWLRLNTDA
jgi:hypothetical protein